MNNLHELLNWIDPCVLEYDEWLSVGMAIKHEGGTAWLWDQWSQRDGKRYKQGECFRKWDGFNGSSQPVTIGTLVEFAKRQGYRPERESRAFDWDDTIGVRDHLRVVDTDWVEDHEIAAPERWEPVQEIITYLRTLFQAEEHVGYVTEAWRDGDRWMPKRGAYDRTAGDLITALQSCNGDVGSVLGDYNPEVGAWVRFNPLDGNGVKDVNITAYRFALIESDTETIERQAAIYSELELPVAALVHSGRKSLHAIVRIDAASKEEYKQRVNFLHEVCKKNGLSIDTQNKNPSRLSRLPGVLRGDAKQFLVATNQGKATWEEWRAWIEEQNDSLPEFESLADVYDSLPPLASPLIDGLLRQGHKMLISGPSKAGKSYILLQLAMAVAEGREWLGWKCAPGRVLYVNLELDRASCLHRLRALYEAHGWAPEHVGNIDLWNLRGKAAPMDVLAPKLIRRAIKRRYQLVIIDPIYKVLTGSENEAHEMAMFCNQFDRLAAELGSAVVYCHHHSKGSQGQKSARDRSSGSGVFARDPDAILDLIELTIDEARRKVVVDRERRLATEYILDGHIPAWRDTIPPDDAVVADKLIKAAFGISNGWTDVLGEAVREAERRGNAVSGWRLEGTLREFPPFGRKHLFFRYPIHVHDADGLLADAVADGEEAPWVAQQRQRTKAHTERKAAKGDGINMAYETCKGFDNEPVLIGDLASHMGISERALKRKLSEISSHVLGSDNVVRTKAEHQRLELLGAIEAQRDLSGYVKLDAVAKALKVSERTVQRRLADTVPEMECKGGQIVEKEGAIA